MVQHNEFGQPIGAALDWSGAVAPQPVVLEGASCRLVPFAMSDLDAVATALFDALAEGGDEQYTYLYFGPLDSAEELAAILRDQASHPDWLPFVVETTDGPSGIAAYLRIAPTDGSMEIGSILYAARLRRTRAATEAMYLLARHAFDLGFRRYEWKCDALNEGSRAAALRLGFRFEGIFRNATVYKGRSRDTAWFAMTDDDWRDEARPALEAWLDPGNHTPNQQRTLGEFRRVAGR